MEIFIKLKILYVIQTKKNSNMVSEADNKLMVKEIVKNADVFNSMP